MNELYIKRNELNKKSQKLRIAKWSLKLTRKQISDLINKQDEVYKRYKFYDNFIKIRGEMKKWINIIY